MRLLNLITCLLTLLVIGLGAYTRLNDAGLGCPDWPGCYGHIAVPSNSQDLLQAQTDFKQIVEPTKAWTEMIHRYLAGSLGLCIFALSALLFRHYKKLKQFPTIPLLLIGLLVFQALLGMWTVTLRLRPVIVMLHLFGGLSLLSILWWQFLRLSKKPVATDQTLRQIRPWAGLALGLLMIQIALGGWTSANYAALICPDFPYCQGSLLPHLALSGFFFGNDNDALITIHMLHRFGAVLVASFLLSLAIATLMRSHDRITLRLSYLILTLVTTQVCLGILNIIWLLPISTAVSHNLIAAMLLISVITFNHRLNNNRGELSDDS